MLASAHKHGAATRKKLNRKSNSLLRLSNIIALSRLADSLVSAINSESIPADDATRPEELKTEVPSCCERQESREAVQRRVDP